jgi:hypothetical protein
MKRATILRRDFLKRMAAVGGAAAAWTLGGMIPESRAFAGTPSQGSPASLKIDPRAAQFLSLVRGTREYRNFKSVLTSPNPIDLWTDRGYQFVSFGVRTAEQLAQAGRSPFQLYSALTFAAGRDGAVIEVFTLRPESDGATSTLSSLRGGQTQMVTHSPGVQAKLADARRQAIGTRESAAVLATAASPTKVAGGWFAPTLASDCDCGPYRRYQCDYQVCGGGFFDADCYWLCSLTCPFAGAAGGPYAAAACMVACRGACYVLPWCSCGQWSCYSCAF